MPLLRPDKFIATLLVLAFTVAFASGASGEKPKLVLIIDDLGDTFEPGMRAIFLPARITVAILPETPYGRALTKAAQSAGQETILHIPMSHSGSAKLGPAALTSAMNRIELQSWLHYDISRHPHISGINNHMGSELTSNPEAMAWFMEELACHRLYFVDSRTTTTTVAAQFAEFNGISHLSRDVFLDNSTEPAELEKQFALWLEIAEQQGYAIAIAHPYKETLDFLEHRLIDLVRAGYQFAHPSEIIQQQSQPPQQLASSEAP